MYTGGDLTEAVCKMVCTCFSDRLPSPPPPSTSIISCHTVKAPELFGARLPNTDVVLEMERSAVVVVVA